MKVIRFRMHGCLQAVRADQIVRITRSRAGRLAHEDALTVITLMVGEPYSGAMSDGNYDDLVDDWAAALEDIRNGY